MRKTIISLFITVFFTINVNGQGIYLDFILLPPYLTFNNDLLKLETRSEGPKMMKIKMKVNAAEKEILLSAEKAKDIYFRTSYEFNLKRYKINDSTQFKVYWLDPDNRKVQLTISSDTKSHDTSSPVYPFRENDKWYYVDNNFNRLSDNFDFVFPFYFHHAVVKIKDKYALINKTMTLITQPIFDEIRQVDYDTLKIPYFMARKEGKYFPIDTIGQLFYDNSNLRTCHLSIGSFLSVITYTSEGKMGLIRVNSLPYDTITPPIYDTISSFPDDDNSYFLVSINQKKGIINENGKVLLPVIYDEIRINMYNNRLNKNGIGMLVCIDKRYGFVDEQFTPFISLKYTDALPFNLGFSLVQTPDGKWGYIDRKGREYWK